MPRRMIATAEDEPSWGYLSYKQVERHLRKLDEINAKIIVEMCQHGSNNVSLIARKVNLPIETVRYRVNLLSKLGVFGLSLYFRYSHLGLLRMMVQCEIMKPKVALAAKAVEIPVYWRYISRAHGKHEGLFIQYAFPSNFADSLREVYEYLKEQEVIRDYLIFSTGDSIPSVPDFTMFNFEKSAWNSPWEKWDEELERASSEIPEELRDPERYGGDFDATDLRLVELIETTGLQKFSFLGSKLGLTAQGVRHHYIEHLYGRRIALGYLPTLLPLPIDLLDIYELHLDFSDPRHMGRFANTLAGKYFVRNYSKILGRNSLIVTFTLTRGDTARLFDLLYRLAEEGWLIDFNYSVLDLRTYKAQTSPPENYVNGAWIYDHPGTMGKLKQLIPPH